MGERSPYRRHFLKMLDSRWQSRQTEDPSRDRIEGATDRTPPVRQYPTVLIQRPCQMHGAWSE